MSICLYYYLIRCLHFEFFLNTYGNNSKGFLLGPVYYSLFNLMVNMQRSRSTCYSFSDIVLYILYVNVLLKAVITYFIHTMEHFEVFTTSKADETTLSCLQIIIFLYAACRFHTIFYIQLLVGMKLLKCMRDFF